MTGEIKEQPRKPIVLVLTPRETVKALSVSLSTLQRLHKSGELIPVRIGHQLRYPLAVLEAYVKGVNMRHPAPRSRRKAPNGQ